MILIFKSIIFTNFIIVALLFTGRSYGAKIIMLLVSINSSLLRSLVQESPVRDGLFVEISHNHINEPHRGDLYEHYGKINRLAHIL
jgi:hypothetical protein